MLQRQKGIILRSARTGEADRILTLLLEDNRSLPLRYHGIRASQKRSQLAIQPGNLVEVVYYEKSEAPVLSIKELSLLQEFQIPPTYDNLQKLAAILALVQASAHGDAPGLFSLCTGALEALQEQVNPTGPGQTAHPNNNASVRPPSGASPPTNAATGAAPSGNNVRHPSETHTVFLDLLAFLIVRIYKIQGLLASPERCSRCETPLWKENSWPPEDMQPSSWILPNLEFLCPRCSLLENRRAQLADTGHALWIYLAFGQRFHRFRDALGSLNGLKFPAASGVEGSARPNHPSTVDESGRPDTGAGQIDSPEILQPNTAGLLVQCIQDFLGNLKELRIYSD